MEKQFVNFITFCLNFLLIYNDVNNTYIYSDRYDNEKINSRLSIAILSSFAYNFLDYLSIEFSYSYIEQFLHLLTLK